MTTSKKPKFTINAITKLSDIANGYTTHLSESDLTIQTSDSLFQYTYNSEEDSKYEIVPGIFTLIAPDSGVELKRLEIREHSLLETVSNTSLIKNEAKSFFNNLHVYRKYNKDPKRAILLYSSPGMGKTSCLVKLSKELIEEDPGTVIVFWDTSAIDAYVIQRFLSTGSFCSSKTTRMMLIIEDIGGGNYENIRGGSKKAEASLLELLDGASVTFRIPTFIVATTNTPESLIKSIADRPGRFDQMFELKPPSPDERVRLAAYIAKRELTEVEDTDLRGTIADGLSIAHISEVIIRSELHNKSFGEVIKEMRDHKNRVDKEFAAINKAMGLRLTGF